ncbi:MAG: hypothetical protein J6B12_04875 [Clostridia bacterium]|nr:hypothetical protein [Clostridia bacterium]
MSYTNKKTVGRIVKICVFLLILVILVANVVQCFRSFYHNLETYKMEHFWKYKWAFANVAKFCLEQFTLALKENETLSQISIDYNLTEKNEFQVTYYYYGDAEPTDQLVPIDQTMIKSFDTVKRAFEQKADG